MPQLLSDPNIRATALDFAVKTDTCGELSTEQFVERAKAFEAYLLGPAVDVAPVAAAAVDATAELAAAA